MSPTANSYLDSLPPQRLTINGRFLLQPITGVQRYALEWTRALDDWLTLRPTWQVRILMPRRWSFHPPLPHYRHIKIEQVGILQGPPWEQLEMPFYLGEETVLCLANTAPVWSLWRGKNIHVTVHDLAYLYFPEAYRFIFKALYHLVIPVIMRHAKIVLTDCTVEKQSMLKYFPLASPRIRVVPLGGLPDHVLRNMAANPSTPPPERLPNTVLYAGSLSPRKNFPRLYRVMQTLAKRRGIKFIIIGGLGGGVVNPDHDPKKSADENIVFLGRADDATLMQHYQTATALVFPSLFEGSGLPPIEAMALGCPVISSNIPALIERCGDAAHYCDPYDEAAIEAAIVAVVDHPSRQAELRQKGYHRAALFTWQNCLESSLQHIFM